MDLAILESLQDGKWGLRELQEATGTMSRQMVAARIGKLMDRGWVEMKAHPTSSCKKVRQVTRSGKAVLAKMKAAVL